MPNPKAQVGLRLQVADAVLVKDENDQFKVHVNESKKTTPKLSKCPRPKFKLRKFTSKAAVLVLIWNFLVNCIFGSMDNLITQFDLNDETFSNIVPFAMLIMVALISGWIADTYLGHYRTAKIGFVLLFIASVLQSVLVVAKHLSDYQYPRGLKIGLVTPTVGLGYGGAAILLVTLPQVGLEQMPDCSSLNITSFISWFVFSVFAGFWVSSLSSSIDADKCIGKDLVTVWSLFPVVCMSIVLISDFILTPKWLIIEPKSSQSLKTVYHVLDFASKHKTPLNRSALTYWEDEIPSRLDLGKSKYGGPYTIEQVENVKTMLRVLALSIPLWICLFSYNMYSSAMKLVNFNGTVLDDKCHSLVVQYFTYDSDLIVIFLIIVYELVIYPLFGHIITSSIRRIGAATVLNAILNILSVFIAIFYYFTDYVPVFVAYAHSFSVALLITLMMTAFLEFVSAQSPHNIRGLLLGYVWCINTFTFAIAALIYYLVSAFDDSEDVLLIHTIISAIISVIGMIAFVLLARWYKGRIRDDDVTPQMWVEAAYDRYLSTEESTNNNVIF